MSRYSLGFCQMQSQISPQSPCWSSLMASFHLPSCSALVPRPRWPNPPLGSRVRSREKQPTATSSWAPETAAAIETEARRTPEIRNLTCGEVVRTENFEWVTLAGIEGQHGLARLFQPALLFWKLKRKLNSTSAPSNICRTEMCGRLTLERHLM